ncbi:hypothetical protein TWF281_010721 [Arthrobotrys megalospora]
MPQSVLHGRIIKASGPNKPSAKPSLVSRAKPISELANHDEELGYYYLSRKYTLQEVHDAMEAIFGFGATLIQYRGYLDKPKFKKALTKKEWQAIAPYYYACQSLGKEVAVKLNGAYDIEPSSVKKQISRSVSATEHSRILRQLALVPLHTSRPYQEGRIEAYVPTLYGKFAVQEIPESLIERLPINTTRQKLLRTFQNTNHSPEAETGLSNVAESGYFKYLRMLLYRLSNNFGASHIQIDELLDKAVSSGYYRLLKGLLSQKMLSVKIAAERLLPLLILRCDEDLISHIFSVHGSFPIKWYTAFRELETTDGYYGDTYLFPLTNERGRLLCKYNTQELRRFLRKGIENNPFAFTCEEAAVLARYAIYHQFIALDFMAILLPSNVTLEEVEQQYEKMYADSIISKAETPDKLRELLKFGFRMYLHITILENILENDIQRFSVLLPYLESELREKILQPMRSSFGDTPLHDIVGEEFFVGLLLEVLKEDGATSYSMYRSWLSLIKKLFSTAYTRSNTGFRDFLLKCLTCAYVNASGFINNLALAGSKVNDCDENSSSNTTLTAVLMALISSADENDSISLNYKVWFEWCQCLIKYGADIGGWIHIYHRDDKNSPIPMYEFSCEDKYNHETRSDYLTCMDGDYGSDIEKDYWPGFDDGTWFNIKNGYWVNVHEGLYWRDLSHFQGRPIHKAVVQGKGDRIKTLLELGADVNALTQRGTSALELAMKGRDPNIFAMLITAKADKSRLLKQYKNKLEPEFAEALRNDDVERLVHTWQYRLKFEIKASDTIKVMQEPRPLRGLLADTRPLIDEPLCMFTGFSGDPTGVPFTALQYLALAGVPELLRCFFQNSLHVADILARKQDSRTATPLQCALAPEQFESEWPLRLECVKVLIENGADPNEPVPNSLVQPILAGMKNMISKSRIFWTTSSDGKSALCYAVQNANLGAARYLIEHGADIYAIVRSKRTDIYKKMTESIVEYAVRKGRIDFVALFLHFDIRCRETAYDAAIKHQQITIAEWIQSEWTGKKEKPAKSSDDFPMPMDLQEEPAAELDVDWGGWVEEDFLTDSVS